MKFGQAFILDASALMRARASQVLAVREDLFGQLISLPLEIAATEMLSAAEIDSALAGGGRPAPAPNDPEDSSQVAIVSIDGPLSQRGQQQLCGFVDGYDWIAGRVIEAANDPKVGAIVLRINSPGGDVAGLDEAVKRMRSAVEKQGKTVIAHPDEQAASAAYRIASGVADEIVLPGSAEVGSIGTIGAWIDATEQLKLEGIAVHIVRDPPGKAAGHPAGPVAEIADARMGETVRDSTANFIESVAERRPNVGGKKALRALDGAMLRGKAAVDAGLADRVGSFEDAVKRAADAANRRRIDMKNAAKGTQALQALQLTDDATEEQIAAAARTFALGAKVMQQTGVADPVAAAAKVGAWQTSHETAVGERAKLAEERLKLEADERVKLYTQQITAGWRTPGTTWAKDGDDRPIAGKLLPHLAAAEIGAVREETKTLCATPRAHGGPPATPPAPIAATGLSELEERECAKLGCDPAVYAQLKTKRDGARLHLVR